VLLGGSVLSVLTWMLENMLGDLIWVEVEMDKKFMSWMSLMKGQEETKDPEGQHPLAELLNSS